MIEWPDLRSQMLEGWGGMIGVYEL
jgi:hypothetical protein